MLNQVIYTRCSPARDLKNKGQVRRDRDGFGVFSISSELFSDQRISGFDVLLNRLATPNGSNAAAPIGLFQSYEYNMVSPGVYALSFETARPLCEIPRANGKTHRGGTFIKQCLIGEIEGYPAEWFGASVWDAHQKSENDYYLDADPATDPPFLPQVSSVPSGGTVDVQCVREFVNDGRAEAVKASIWFLLQEFRKPEEERKVLLIKDVPENVEKWIAAIEYGFSASMAREITFTTNCSALDDVQRNKVLFYYTDNAGHFYPSMKSTSQTRHPYYMIAGYHPKDNTCSSVRQLAASNFVLLDGTTKTIAVQPDGTVCMKYYSAAIRYDEDIQYFCSTVLPGLPLHGLTDKLPELFDSYKYLLDPGHKSDKWEYNETIRNLEVLLQFGHPDSSDLNSRLINGCVNAYRRFAKDDEANRYLLLKSMWSLAKDAGGERDITGCIADILSDKLNHLIDRNDIAATWRALISSGMTVVIQSALRELFNDTELRGYAEQFNGASAASIEAVLEMFFAMLSSEKDGMDSITADEEKYYFIRTAIFALWKLNEQSHLTAALRKINSAPCLFNDITMSIAARIEKDDPAGLPDWWDTAMSVCGGNVLDFCRRLCDSEFADIGMVEHLLANKVEQEHRFDHNVGRAFGEAVDRLEKKPDTGKRLYRAWIQAASPSEFSSIISAIRSSQPKLLFESEKELFELVDEKLPYDPEAGIYPNIYSDMDQWAGDLVKPSRSASFYEFRRGLIGEQNVKKAITSANTLTEKKFSVDAQFLCSNYFAGIITASAGFCDAEMHIAILCLFKEIKGSSMEYYVDMYVSRVLSETKSRSLVPQLMSLTEAIMGEFHVQGQTDKFVSNVQRCLDRSLAGHLADYYKPSLADQVRRYNDCDPSVKTKLMELLKDAGEKAKPKGLIGFLNNLIDKRK